MHPSTVPSKVYHGTDAASGESIRQEGLNEVRWRIAAGTAGVDEKGFSVTGGRAVAELWAVIRSAERGGPPEGMVLEADANRLPLQTGQPGTWTDPEEFFIASEDFPSVGPGVFQ